MADLADWTSIREIPTVIDFVGHRNLAGEATWVTSRLVCGQATLPVVPHRS